MFYGVYFNKNRLMVVIERDKRTMNGVVVFSARMCLTAQYISKHTHKYTVILCLFFLACFNFVLWYEMVKCMYIILTTAAIQAWNGTRVYV